MNFLIQTFAIFLICVAIASDRENYKLFKPKKLIWWYQLFLVVTAVIIIKSVN